MGDTDFEIQLTKPLPDGTFLPLTKEEVHAIADEVSGLVLGGIYENETGFDLSHGNDEVNETFFKKLSTNFPGVLFTVEYFGEGTDERGTIKARNGKSACKEIEVIWPKIVLEELK